VFLDRDGTLGPDAGTRSITRFELYPWTARALARLHAARFLLVVATNQPVVARGMLTEAQLAAVHARLQADLAADGAPLAAVYHCPHHPAQAVVPALGGACACRKPKPGMLVHAARELEIDLASSYLIGDGDWDIGAGRAAGCTTVYLGDQLDTGATFQCPTLREAVDWILAHEARDA